MFANAFEEKLKEGANVFILQNHGVTTIGKGIKETYRRLETLESTAFIGIMTKILNKLHEIPNGKIQELLKMNNIKRKE